MTSCVYLSILIPENNVNKANTRLKRKRDETVPIENAIPNLLLSRKASRFPNPNNNNEINNNIINNYYNYNKYRNIKQKIVNTIIV